MKIPLPPHPPGTITYIPSIIDHPINRDRQLTLTLFVIPALTLGVIGVSSYLAYRRAGQHHTMAYMLGCFAATLAISIGAGTAATHTTLFDRWTSDTRHLTIPDYLIHDGILVNNARQIPVPGAGKMLHTTPDLTANEGDYYSLITKAQAQAIGDAYIRRTAVFPQAPITRNAHVVLTKTVFKLSHSQIDQDGFQVDLDDEDRPGAGTIADAVTQSLTRAGYVTLAEDTPRNFIIIYADDVPVWGSVGSSRNWSEPWDSGMPTSIKGKAYKCTTHVSAMTFDAVNNPTSVTVSGLSCKTSPTSPITWFRP